VSRSRCARRRRRAGAEIVFLRQHAALLNLFCPSTSALPSRPPRRRALAPSPLLHPHPRARRLLLRHPASPPTPNGAALADIAAPQPCARSSSGVDRPHLRALRFGLVRLPAARLIACGSLAVRETCVRRALSTSAPGQPRDPSAAARSGLSHWCEWCARSRCHALTGVRVAAHTRSIPPRAHSILGSNFSKSPFEILESSHRRARSTSILVGRARRRDAPLYAPRYGAAACCRGACRLWRYSGNSDVGHSAAEDADRYANRAARRHRAQHAPLTPRPRQRPVQYGQGLNPLTAADDLTRAIDAHCLRFDRHPSDID